MKHLFTKNIVIFAVLMSPLALYAQTFEDPATLCDGRDSCTTQMKQISTNYSEGSIEFIKRDLSAYSGECFHVNPDYDPEHIHHGAFVFKTKDQQTITAGLFSFFSAEDPYKDLSAIQLAQRLSDSSSYAPVHIVANSHLELAYISTNSDIRYWFRSNPSATRLFVIGRNTQIQSSTLVFCEMNLHQMKFNR